jgi:hypothetical protein|tara:strand:+ start:613 stop:1209 length:597 start_codon:yes stop_codon:yes gene_type:complete
MMEFIAHRINTVEQLKKVPKEYGVEVDLRDYGDKLILQHDPFTDGEDFEKYLKYYNHGTIILNIKSERIEFRIIDLLMKYKVKDYFFLDCSFPMIYLLSEQGEKNIALRFSEFEGLDTIINMRGKVNWVWVDCFTRMPIDRTSAKSLQSIGYKTCLVSPDLQGQPDDIEEYKSYIGIKKIFFDAVCVKNNNISKWIFD